MLRLTPLRETTSGQELLKEDRVEILSALIQAKFTISAEVMETIRSELQKLPLETLKLLASQHLKISTIEQLEVWIAEHLPQDQQDGTSNFYG